MANNSLSQKTILITGGTSQLGQAFVRKACAEGGRVFFTFHQNQKLAQELAQLGAEALELDLLNFPKMDEFCALVKSKLEHLDVLIHNAAVVRDHTIQNLTEQDWDEVLAADLKAPYYLTKKLMPLLFRRKKRETASPSGHNGAIDPAVIASEAKQPASKIFFITSRAAVTGGFGISNYAAAKAGLIALAKSLAQELGKKQILVNAVNPGFMKSRMTEALPEMVLQQHLELSPVGRYSNPEEVADFLIYLSSNAMTQATGQTFHFESRKI